MKTTSKKVFAITNVSCTRILTEIGWVGLFLSPDSMPVEKVYEKLYSGFPLTDSNSMFERRGDNDDYIQYYKTFERAAQVAYEVANRSNKPITEPLAIVTIDVDVSLSITTVFDGSPKVDDTKLVAFEAAVSKQLNCDINAIKQCRRSDLSGYNYPAFQNAYVAWMTFNACLIQE